MSILTIYCTELAALAGRHLYRSVPEAVDALLCHNEQAVFRSYPHLRGRLREARLREAASRKAEFLCRKRHADTLESSLTKMAKAESADELRFLLDDALATIDDPDEREIVKGVIFKTRGLDGEDAVLDAYEKLTGKKLTERNTVFRKSKPFTTRGGVTYQIGGRLDAVCDELGRLVEVKNRVNKFHIPAYDRIQVMGYFAITGLQACEFIQCLCGELQTETLTYDEDAWIPVQRALEDTLDRHVTPDPEPEQDEEPPSPSPTQTQAQPSSASSEPAVSESQ